MAAEDHGCADAQPAHHFPPPGFQHVPGGIQVLQRLRAALVEHLAVLGQPQAARGAHEQPRAQALFQPRHGLANSRARKAQALGRLGEAAGLGRGDESADACQPVICNWFHKFYKP